jgi:hypothetical protein
MNNELAMTVLHPNWQFFVKHLKGEREKLVSSLLQPVDVDATNLLRGQIRELDTLLRLTEQAKRFKEGKL